MAEAPQAVDPLKVAIVHDWLIGGGAERVVEQLHQLYPASPIYTACATPKWQRRLDHQVITSYMQYWPLFKLRKYLPLLRQHWFSHLDLSAYDLVISSSGAEAKGVKVPAGATHINYCHAPTHYYWGRFEQYLQDPGFRSFNWLARLGLKLLVGPLRRWDKKAAQRPDFRIANSTYIQEQIKKYYGRDSVVIHPPVNVDKFAGPSEAGTRAGLVIAGRQTPYKRTDLAVAACTQLGLPLRVIGNGPDHRRLVKMAGPTITFLTKTGNAQLVEHFKTATGFIFPSLDDFGIVAVEALAAGTPLIAYKGGGALDYVLPGKTGQFFGHQTVESLVKSLESFKPDSYDQAALRQTAKEFAPPVFRKKMKAFVSECLGSHDV
jgi:glycosyltransferase involved in cell wall biosynthesis